MEGEGESSICVSFLHTARILSLTRIIGNDSGGQPRVQAESTATHR